MSQTTFFLRDYGTFKLLCLTDTEFFNATDLCSQISNITVAEFLADNFVKTCIRDIQEERSCEIDDLVKDMINLGCCSGIYLHPCLIDHTLNFLNRQVWYEWIKGANSPIQIDQSSSASVASSQTGKPIQWVSQVFDDKISFLEPTLNAKIAKLVADSNILGKYTLEEIQGFKESVLTGTKTLYEIKRKIDSGEADRLSLQEKMQIMKDTADAICKICEIKILLDEFSSENDQ